MQGLDCAINVCLDRAHAKIGALSVSWGAAQFGGDAGIKAAIAAADSAMYEQKSKRKSGGAQHAR
jgi:GGDEF domain-containing protein